MNAIKDQLKTLKYTNTTFTECFKFKDKDHAEAEVNLNILSVFTQLTRTTKTGKIVNTNILVQFHPIILKSLQETNVVPWNWESMIAIENQKAKAYFTKIDRTLAGLVAKKNSDSVTWTRTMKGVVADMKLPKESYEWAYQRKDLAEQMVNHLHGMPLSIEGITLSIKYIKTADQKDYKLICETRGTSRPQLKIVNGHQLSMDIHRELVDFCAQHGEETVTQRSSNTLRKFAQMYRHQDIYTAMSVTKEAIDQAKETGKRIETVGGLLVDNIKRIDAAGKTTAAAAKLALAAT